MLTVGIKNYIKDAFVGLYEEEYIIPNKLRFNIEITIGDENQFIDYTYFISLINDQLLEHRIYLEDILKDILKNIKNKIVFKTLNITIEKLNPPTGYNIESSYIRWCE